MPSVDRFDLALAISARTRRYRRARYLANCAAPSVFLDDESPACGEAAAAYGSAIAFRVVGSNDAGNLRVDLTRDGGPVESVILDGAFQAGYSGTVRADGPDLLVLVAPDDAFGLDVVVAYRARIDSAGSILDEDCAFAIQSVPDFRVLLVTPVGSNALRAYFSEEPRHFSPVSADDARNRLNWDVAVIAGAARDPTPTIVEDAVARPDDVPAVPEAWSADVRVDARVLSSAVYETVAADLRSTAGHPLGPPPYDRGTCAGNMKRARPHDG